MNYSKKFVLSSGSSSGLLQTGDMRAHKTNERDKNAIIVLHEPRMPATFLASSRTTMIETDLVIHRQPVSISAFHLILILSSELKQLRV